MRLRRSTSFVSEKLFTKQAQFSVTFVMSIQKILSPLLRISYICGLRLIELPANVPKRARWFGLLYMLSLWSVYYIFYIYGVLPYVIHYSTLYHIWFALNIFTALSSIIVGVYHDKTFKKCIKNLTIVDETLQKLGKITDDKLYVKTVWLILGWLILCVITICEEFRLRRMRDNQNIAQSLYIPIIHRYCIHINIINDFTIISLFRYVGLKFDQINEHIQKLTKSNQCILKRTWEHPVLPLQSKYTKTSESGHIIWIVIHLYSELRKICRIINSIFGALMTLEMGCFFACIALVFYEIFNIIFINDYNYNHKTLYIVTILTHLFIDVLRLFFTNYECERISIKANETGNFVSKLLYSNCDVEIHENVLQLSLMIQSPLRFCGLGLFQFGFKFLQRFITSMATVLVILIQAHTNK